MKHCNIYRDKYFYKNIKKTKKMHFLISSMCIFYGKLFIHTHVQKSENPGFGNLGLWNLGLGNLGLGNLGLGNLGLRNLGWGNHGLGNLGLGNLGLGNLG